MTFLVTYQYKKKKREAKGPKQKLVHTLHLHFPSQPMPLALGRPHHNVAQSLGWQTGSPYTHH